MTKRMFLLGMMALAMLVTRDVMAAPQTEYTLTVDYPEGATKPGLVSGFKKSVEQFKTSHQGVTVVGEVEVELVNGRGQWLGMGRYPAVEIFGKGDYTCVLRMVASQRVDVSEVLHLVAKFTATRG